MPSEKLRCQSASWGPLTSEFRLCTPLRIESRSVVKRFLRSDAGRREPGIKVGAPDGFPLRESFAEKGGEAADERIARACAVHTLHRERRHMLHPIAPREQRSVGAERNNHASDSAGQ